MDAQQVENSLCYTGHPPRLESSEVKTELQGSGWELHNGRPNSTQSVGMSLHPDGIRVLSITFSVPTSPMATSKPNAPEACKTLYDMPSAF